jgi:hypothetical protein
VIGCMDTRAARKVVHAKVTGHQSDTPYWFDLGNHATGGQFVSGSHGTGGIAAVERAFELCPRFYRS